MMGYVSAFTAVFCGAVKGFCGKQISAYTGRLSSAAYLNYLRMLLCIGIGAVLVFMKDGAAGFRVTPMVFAISAFSGVVTSVHVISWLFAVRRGAYMLVDVFLALGVVVPMSLSSIYFEESIFWSDIIGVLFLIIAAGFLCSYNSKMKCRMEGRDVMNLMLVGMANGLVGFSQKLFVYHSDGHSIAVFNFYTYIFSALVLWFFFRLSKKGGGKNTVKLPGNAYGYVVVMAVCLFGYSFFNTMAAEVLSSAQLYPLSQGAGLIASACMASVFWGEKVKIALVVGICFDFIGLLVINLL